MRKTLLIAAMALATVSASAVNHAKKAALPIQEKKAAFVTPGAFKDFTAKQEAMNAFYQTTELKAPKLSLKGAKRAEDDATLPDESELIPCYSTWTYHYSECYGGFAPQMMYDEASFVVKDGSALFRPFARLGYVAGKVEEGTNIYTKEGADSITFYCDVIASYTNQSTGEKTELTLAPCIVENYVPSRIVGQTTFGAYYFAEDNALYIPSSVTLALFPADDESVTEIFTPYYVARRLWLEPQESYNEYISKGTAKGDSYYAAQYGESVNFSRDAQILLGYGYYYVKGADYFNEDAWIEFEVDEQDQSLAKVEEMQFVGEGSWYTDASRTDTYDAALTTVGAYTDSDGELENWTSDYSSSYKITDNADETTTITSTNNTLYGEYMYALPSSKSGMYNWLALTININYEPITNGIKTITNTEADMTGVTYNLAGQRVSANQKGLVIKNGKKFMNK